MNLSEIQNENQIPQYQKGQNENNIQNNNKEYLQEMNSSFQIKSYNNVCDQNLEKNKKSDQQNSQNGKKDLDFEFYNKSKIYCFLTGKKINREDQYKKTKTQQNRGQSQFSNNKVQNHTIQNSFKKQIKKQVICTQNLKQKKELSFNDLGQDKIQNQQQLFPTNYNNYSQNTSDYSIIQESDGILSQFENDQQISELEKIIENNF
ncbi:hypothetical protein PPERSA_11219 [Pseudocohnilembus persalinus]|uniref:Uncharacterized protein n=1 Tax=Pseudocohnilembus persalinus TaxID=266149 RepID=A0A0V0QZH7_PSEPJ|nr:hypothetical protein PPERSA_11219 [Pseudocohnilembus persalinus]|eukprot:KRX07670.1 hypothetical protein PPERSA_11219 [Pseudocohnilembus persalinus]